MFAEVHPPIEIGEYLFLFLRVNESVRQIVLKLE
jgi:hypothetical protein